MKSLVLLVVAALVATGPVALAADHPHDRPGLQGPMWPAIDPAAWQQSGRPDGRDRPDAADLVSPAPTVIVAADPFDWGDAGIGLAGGLGLMLVLGGVLASVQYARRVQSAS